MKTCLLCRIEKALTEFYRQGRTGTNPYCKACCKVNRSLEAVRKRDKKVKISNRQRYRAKTLGVKYDEDITLAGVFKKCLGMCHICSLWVMPKHASLEHKKPLSKGGTHEHHNVLLAHIKCNLKKGDR